MAIAATPSEDEHKQIKEGRDKDYSSNSNSNNDTNNKFTEDEFEVANVLLQLRSLISIKNNKQSVVYSKFEYNWGTKKRRSAIANPPNYTNLVKHQHQQQQQQASSPNTPLSFSPKKYTAPLRLRKKELKEAVEDKLQTQQQLKVSIQKVKEYLKTIMAENSALKAKKRQLVNGEKWERKKRMKATSSCNLQVVQSPPLIDYHDIQDVHILKQQLPLIHPRHQYYDGGAVAVYAGTSLQLHYQQQQQPYPMLQYHHHHNRSQQHVVQIDLNVLPSAEDEQVIKRVEAQEARKKRMRVNKEKKTRVAPNP